MNTTEQKTDLEPIGAIKRLMGIDNLTLTLVTVDEDNVRTESWEHSDGRLVVRSIDLDSGGIILITLFPALEAYQAALNRKVEVVL